MKKYSLPLEKLGIGFMPYLSLIVPVYNRPQEVQELLESLAAQDSRDFEIIIVEDGSTVRCDRIVEQYKSAIDIKYFFKENSGPGLTGIMVPKEPKGNMWSFSIRIVLFPGNILRWYGKLARRPV